MGRSGLGRFRGIARGHITPQVMRSSQNSNAGAQRGLPNVEPVSEPKHVGGPRAVYDVSADAYVRFVGVEISAATEGSIDRALLYAFVEMASAANSGRIADIGCGPGRVAAFLARLGVVTPYDATYVALAEGLSCTLLTADERLARSPSITLLTVHARRPVGGVVGGRLPLVLFSGQGVFGDHWRSP